VLMCVWHFIIFIFIIFII